MNNPFVSVVICTYKKRNSLQKAIDSVLNSDYSNFELIVVDDGGKSEIPKKGFKLIKQKHKGLAAARNTGIKNSSGEIIAFTDDDCIVEKNWLKEIVLAFDLNTSAISGKSIEYFDKPKQHVLWICNKFGRIKINSEKLKKNDFISVHGCNMAFTRKALEKVNFFDESFPYFFEEIDLSARIHKKKLKIKVNEKAIVHHFLNKNIKYGNNFEFIKFKYYFALKNFNSFFFFPLLVFNDFPVLLNELKDLIIFFTKKKISFFDLFRLSYLVFVSRVSGTKKFLLKN